MIFPLECLIQCCLKLCGISYDCDTDAGASATWLYNTWKCQSKLCHVVFSCLFCHSDSFRCRNITICKQLLCHIFVHGNGAAQIIASCVFDSKQIECCLKLSVLSILSVQSHKHNVCHLTHTDDIWSEETRGLVFS